MKKEKESAINPAAVGVKGCLFGLPFTYKSAKIAIIPVPWEVTVSYSAGCAKGPEAVLEASSQIDCFDENYPDAWKQGVFMLPVNEEWREKSIEFREMAKEYIDGLENGEKVNENHPTVKLINKASKQLNIWLKKTALGLIRDGKMPAVLGGDHSTPLGLVHALAEHHDDFSVLQIDAHADLRIAFEGFKYSHASIMHNILQTKQVTKMVQVGIRDYCQDEYDYSANSEGRITTFYDWQIKENAFKGMTWDKQCDEITAALGQKVYISFDIDGLDPKLCPNTGTPVAGGFELQETLYLIKKIKQSGRQIIGFDLCEVAPGEDGGDWDGNVGARLLFRLCNFMGN